GFACEVGSAKQTEHALQAARQVYRQLLEAINAYRYTVRVENGVSTSTEHSAACLSATGYTPEEYAVDPFLWIHMVHLDDREAVERHVASVLDHLTVSPIEHRIRHKDGSVRWVRDTIVSHFDDAGTLVRYDGLVEDITERKRVEERFRRFVESAPDGMVIIDHEGRIVLVNAATERLFGFAREELYQQPVEVLMPERFREGHSGRRDAYVAGPKNRLMGERELVCRRKDGTEFPAEISLSPIETEEGLLIAAAVREVTQRKRMEGKIRANLQIQSTLTALLKLSLEPLTLEEQLERALDLLAAVPWIELESKGAVFLAEEGSEELVMKAQRGLGDSVIAGCGRLPSGRCLCGRAAATRQIVFASCLDERHEMCFPDMLPHGHYCVPIVSGDELIGVINLYLKHGHQQTPDEEDFLAAAANVLAGIVKRKRAEESLRKSEERFELAVQGTEAGVWDWDLRTNQVYYSALWKRMLGYEQREIEDEYTAWEGLLHPDDRQRALATVRDYLDGKTEEYELEHRLRHKDGSYRWILARGALVRDVDGKPYRMVGSHLDVTERKLSERRLREREAQLLAAQHIQEHLLPPGSPTVPGFDIAGRVFPAEFAAGDYFDYLCFPDGALGIAIGDVCGHGVGAALLTATTIAHFRSLAEDHTDVGEISAHANSMLCWETEAGRFVTNLLAHVDLKSRMVHYVGAGHPWGYVLTQSGDVKSILKSSALPLAIMRETEFPVSGPVGLETGDLVLLVTDGLLEAQSPDGVLFGTERTLELVRANRHLKASEIIETLHAA
ncbi:MAG: PAS domain S-box protein, partial [Planctomycetes bacterium]|nr:PAS domain S-box protein [Planctomycetota bacterium]